MTDMKDVIEAVQQSAEPSYTHSLPSMTVSGTVAKHTRIYNRERAEAAMRDFLEAIGEDLNDPNVSDTPKRVTKMFCEELLAGHNMVIPASIFPTQVWDDQFVVVYDIDVFSMCSHHLMPFRGVAHVAAWFQTDSNGNANLPGLSKYARIVDKFSRRLQLQERITSQVLNEIMEQFKPDWAMVYIDAVHMCMCHRGVRSHQSGTITTAQRLSENMKKNVRVDHTIQSDRLTARFMTQMANRSGGRKL